MMENLLAMTPNSLAGDSELPLHRFSTGVRWTGGPGNAHQINQVDQYKYTEWRFGYQTHSIKIQRDMGAILDDLAKVIMVIEELGGQLGNRRWDERLLLRGESSGFLGLGWGLDSGCGNNNNNNNPAHLPSSKSQNTCAYS